MNDSGWLKEKNLLLVPMLRGQGYCFWYVQDIYNLSPSYAYAPPTKTRPVMDPPRLDSAQIQESPFLGEKKND